MDRWTDKARGYTSEAYPGVHQVPKSRYLITSSPKLTSHTRTGDPTQHTHPSSPLSHTQPSPQGCDSKPANSSVLALHTQSTHPTLPTDPIPKQRNLRSWPSLAYLFKFLPSPHNQKQKNHTREFNTIATVTATHR